MNGASVPSLVYVSVMGSALGCENVIEQTFGISAELVVFFTDGKNVQLAPSAKVKTDARLFGCYINLERIARPYTSGCTDQKPA